MLLVLIIIFLQIILSGLVGVSFALVQAWLDRRHPDNLSLVAGEWAQRQLAQLKLDVTVLAGKRNCYVESLQTILLTDETYRKADPSFWATAAHEIGHALFRARLRWLSLLFTLARAGARELAVASLVFLVGNFLYGLPIVDTVARQLLVASLLLAPFVLADELAASVLGLLLLRREGEMTGVRFTAATIKLAAAFATYVAHVLGQTILLAAFARVRAVVEGHAFTAAALPSWRVLPALLLSAILVVRVVLILRALGRPLALDFDQKSLSAMLRELAWDVPVLLLVALMWKLPLGTSYVFCVLLAIYAARQLASFVFTPVYLVSGMLLIRLLRRLEWKLRGQPLDRRARAISTAGHAERLREAQQRLGVNPGWLRRAYQLIDLLFIPLVIRLLMLWLG